MANARWHYCGDKNPEYGGFWYRLNTWQHSYVDCVRITPCSDAGGPDNQFWVERLTVNVPDADSRRLAEALNTCGAIDEYETATRRQRQHMSVQCCVAYGLYDVDRTEAIQIGPKSEFFNWDSCGWDPIREFKKLRAGSVLENYVRREYLRQS